MLDAPPAPNSPKTAKLTNNGPTVVPRLLMPPAMLKRWLPVSGLPNKMANGFAAVCWNENPMPTTISPPRSKLNDAESAAGMNNKVPKVLMKSPTAMPFP